MKVTYLVDVEFDETLTTAEEIEKALNLLIQNALSTPGILEGDPQVGNLQISETDQIILAIK
jgi:hypothetical protein